VPKVSVIIPVYNGERYLSSAIESVLNQTYEDLEVIVVDDGSTDRSQDIILNLKESITYIYQSNSGVAAARNRGFLQSRGELIAFLDQDDRWYSHKIETQIEILGQRGDIGIVYSDVDLIDETGHEMEICSLEKTPRPSFLSRFPEFPNPHPLPSTVLMRREIFSLAGMFDPTFKRNCHEDTELWFRIVRRNLGKFHFHPASLLQRRQHSLEGGKDRQSREDNWIVCLNKLMLLYESDAKRVRTLKHMLASTYRHQGKRLAKIGEWQKGRMYLKKALDYEPWNWKNLLVYSKSLVDQKQKQIRSKHTLTHSKLRGIRKQGEE
jgi:glycosyltransferase involved in cell wall biosynthesis